MHWCLIIKCETDFGSYRERRIKEKKQIDEYEENQKKITKSKNGSGAFFNYTWHVVTNMFVIGLFLNLMKKIIWLIMINR